MRVLFTRFPLESALGGAEIQTLSLMRGLVERGHTVLFLGSCPILLRECAALGIESVQCDIGPPPVTKMHVVSFFWRKQAMRRIMKAHVEKMRPDAVCMLSLSEKLLLSDALHRAGKRVVWIEHDRVGPWLQRNPWLATLKRASLSATIVCVSRLSASLYRAMGFAVERIAIIQNGIDATRFSHRARVRNESSVLEVGCVARLSAEKGIDVLLSAAFDCPHVSLTIVGIGNQENFLRKLIDSMDLQLPGTRDRMRIIASVPDLGHFYASLDAFVLPSSDHDPFGLTAAEAMSVGVPTIVTDACGIADYFTSGHDLLVAKSGDVSSLTQCLHDLTDPALRAVLHASGMKAVRKICHHDAMVEAYETLLTAN